MSNREYRLYTLCFEKISHKLSKLIANFHNGGNSSDFEKDVCPLNVFNYVFIKYIHII